MKSRHGWDVVCTTGARATSPARKSVNPGCRRRFRTRWSAPRRRSASTSNVRCFAYENASARLELTNDFPSPLPGLVTMTTIGPEAGSHSFTKLRRRPRNASTTASGLVAPFPLALDRKSTRLNSSHLVISYAVFCLKKKKKENTKNKHIEH